MAWENWSKDNNDEPQFQKIELDKNAKYANPELAALERGAVSFGKSIIGIPAMLAGTAGATAPSVSADMAMDMDGYTPLDPSLQNGINQALDTAHSTTAPIWNGIENNARYAANSLPAEWQPAYEVGGARKFADAVIENAPQMAGQAALAMVNPALSAATLAGSTGGGEYLDLRNKGVDAETAGQASLLNAAAQTPLEYVPMERWLNARRILGKHGLLKPVANSMFSEGATEAVQEIPDEMTAYYAEHGTLDGFNYGQLGLNAAEAGAVGAVYGGLFARINAAAHKPQEGEEPASSGESSYEAPEEAPSDVEENPADAEEPSYGAGEPGPSIDATPQNNFAIADDADFDGEADNTKVAAYAVINEFKRRHPDIEITLTSGKRNGDGSSHHDTGNAFDVVSPAFEGEDGRALRDEYGEIASSMGLTPLDEYDGSGNEKYARGENFHVTIPENWHAPQSSDPASSILAAIGGQESGGDYGAVNGSTGAYGKYQITDDTWNTYADAAGVGADAERTPENQEKVAKYMMDKYYHEFGTDGAIVAWYAGEGTARDFVNGKLSEEAMNRPQPGGPSIAEYLASVKSRIKGPVGGGAPVGNTSTNVTPTKSAEDFLKDLESSIPLDTREHIDEAGRITDILENGSKSDWEKKAREMGWNPPQEPSQQLAAPQEPPQEPEQTAPQAPAISPMPQSPSIPQTKPIQRMEITKGAPAPAFASAVNGRAIKTANRVDNGRMKVGTSAVQNLPSYEEGRPAPSYEAPINGRQELASRMGNEYANRSDTADIGNGGGTYQSTSANREELNSRMRNDYGNKANPVIQKALKNPVLTNLVKRAYVDGDMGAMQRLEALKINPNILNAVRENVEGESNANNAEKGRVLHSAEEDFNNNTKSQEGSVQEGQADKGSQAEQGITYENPIRGREALSSSMRNEYANRNGVADIGTTSTAPLPGSIPNKAELGRRMRNSYDNTAAPLAGTEAPAAPSKPTSNEWVNERHQKIDSIKKDADEGKISPKEAKKRLNRVILSSRHKGGITESQREGIRQHAINANNAIQNNSKKETPKAEPKKETPKVEEKPKAEEKPKEVSKKEEAPKAEANPAETPKETPKAKASYSDKGGYARGSLNNGEITVWHKGRQKSEGFTVTTKEIEDAMNHGGANAKYNLNQFIKRKYFESVERWIEGSDTESLRNKRRELWENEGKYSGETSRYIDSAQNVVENLYTSATGHPIERNFERFRRIRKQNAKAEPKKAPAKVEPKKAPAKEEEKEAPAKEEPKKAPAKEEPKKARTDDEIISDAEDKMVRIANFYQKGLITSDEAQNRIVDAYKASYKEVKSVKAKEKLNTTMRGVVYKVTHQTVEESGNGSFETFRKGVMEDAKKLLDSPKFLSFDKKAKEILGEKLYNDVYLPTLSQLLMGDRSVKTSAGESALLFTKMVKSFHDNYGFDVSPLYIFADRGKRRKTETVEINGVKYASSTLGSYNALTNIISLSSQARKETFMHESAHFYMAMLRKYSTLTDNEIDKYFGGNKAEAEKAIQKIRKDLATIEKWASYNKNQLKEYKGTKLESEFTDRANKIEKGDESERSAWLDERFARGFEQYLAEGKAPSKELEGVFSRFKKWLIDIYNGIKGLNQKELSPEIQKFYDSMINGTVKVEGKPAGKSGVEAKLAGKPKGADKEQKARKFKEETVRTDSGKEFNVTYRIKEADDVISSNDADFVPDNRYPPQLQPRDRSRSTMKEQVDNISRKLSPPDLAESRNVNEGAPIINSNSVVENGNGRTMAIKRAYALKGEAYQASAKAYKDYLVKHAEEYGYTPDEIRGMKNPILVRERTSESDGLQKDIIHSTAGGMEMSGSQRAKSDAEKITPRITALYNYDGSGDLTLESNREFVATVLNTIAGKNEKDRLFDSDGNPSKEGIERVKNAITAAAFKNNELIERMSESTDDDMKNVVKAYSAVAPRVASIAKRIETGDVLESYDLPKVLSDALDIYFKCKGNKKAIQNELDTPSLFGGDKVSQPVKEFVNFMADNTRKPRAISDAISRMVDYVDGANEKSADLWEGTRRTLNECVDAAIHEPPKYLITNKNLKADSKINVVELTGKIKKGPVGPISTQLAKKLKDCVFHIDHESIDVGFFSSYDRKHFTFGGKGIPRNNKARRWAISDEQNIKKIIENSVYVEEEENRHLGEPEPRNHRNDKFHFVQFMSVVKSGNAFVRLRISTLKLPDGTFEVKDVGLYEIAPAGYVKKSFTNKKEYQSPQAATNKREDLSRADTLYTVSVADALTGVKDRKGRPYVKDGKLQYDAAIHPVKNMISSDATSVHTAEVMRKQVLSNFPNAKNVEVTENSMSFDLPNGKHVTVNFTDNTIGVDFDSAQKDYGGKLSGNERAVGRLETVGEDAIMTLSTDTVEQVPAHEAMHLAMNFLTERERKALEAKYGNDEEAMCEAYRAWKIARSQRRGTLLGKIWQKIADIGRRLAGFFETHFHETSDNVFRKVSEGQMWERKADNDSARHVAYMMVPSNEVLKNLKSAHLKVEGKFERRFKPEYAKAKLNDRITVKERPESRDWSGADVALNNTILSPSRIKDPIVRRLFRYGDEATKTQQKLHNRWTRKHTEALSLLKTKKEQDMFDSIMFDEDFNGREYSEEELKKRGVPQSVIKCHERSRNLLRQIYSKVNDVYTHAHVETQTFESEKEAKEFLDDLENRPHTEILTGVNKVTFDGTTAYQVSYKTGRYWVRTATLDDKALEQLDNDKDCYVVSAGKPHQTNLNGMVTTVTFLQYAKPLTNREGYVPHIFHDWMIIRRFKDEKGEEHTEVVGSATTGEKAVVEADKLSKKMDGEFLIAGKKMSSEGEIENPLLLGDKDYENLMGNLTSGTALTLKEAKELTHAQKEGRHVFFGALHERTGAKGYEKNARWAIQHHIDSAARYCALDPFKENAVNLFERAYGRYADDWNGKSWAASFCKGYIDSMLGKTGVAGKAIDNLIHMIPAFKNMQNPGKRISSALLGFTSVIKLGASPSAALVNVLQICNANGYIGPKWVKLGLSKARHPSLTDLKILKALGTDDEVGLGTNSDFGKVRLEDNALGRFTDTYNLVADKIMKPFTYAEHLIRRATVLGAYYKRYGELTGDHETRDRIAKKYALDINRKVNFDYSTADSPRMFRALRGTIAGDLLLQFQKYGTKELEVISDFIPTSSTTTAKQKAMFFVPYLLIGGLWNALPFEDLILSILGMVTGVDDPEKAAKKAMMEWAGQDSAKRALVSVANYGAGAIVGADISQRVGLKGTVPEVDSLKQGGAFGSTVTGLARGILNADPGSALKSVMPEAGNIYQAMAGYTTDSKGRRVVDLDGWDRAMKVLGFRTTREAEATDAQGIIYNYKESRNADRAKAKMKYAEEPSAENYNKLIDLGYTSKQIKAFEKDNPRETGRVDRAQKGLSKADKKELAGVIDYAK